MGKNEKVSRWFISIGLVVFVIHNPNQPLINVIFLPSIGLALITIPVLFYLANTKLTMSGLGSKWVWIPLAIIALSIVLQPLYVLVTEGVTWGVFARFGLSILGILWFGLYLISRKLGDKVFDLFTPAIIIAALSTVYSNALNLGIKNGGIISPTNYDMATGFLVFGLLVSSVEKRWWLSAITLVGLFFTGADEAIFAVIILFTVILIRRDWSKKLLLPIGALLLAVTISFPFGIPQNLYYPTYLKLTQLDTALAMSGTDVKAAVVLDNSDPGIPSYYTTKSLTKDEMLNEATGYRWLVYWKLSPIKPLGYGYNINQFYKGIPHNVVLIIIEQIGILAALAWLWVVGYGIFKTKWVYAWVGILALSVFDHFIWTQAAPWFWVLAGVSTTSGIKTDLIFRG